MLECEICGTQIKNTNSLGKHLYHSHPDISKEEYYKTYINEVSDICCCGSKKKFRGLGEGYRQFCSVKCRSEDVDIRTKISVSKTGVKQTEEHINNRVNNTNQTLKEETRKRTMVKKYGVNNPSLVPEFAEKIRIGNTGKKMPPRTTEHSQNIVQSRIKNGTLNPGTSVRSKISKALNSYYQEGNDQSVTVSKMPSNGRGHKTGYHNGILYRSSYELLFILFCERNEILIRSCENKKHRVRYEYDGKKRWYYPDFYLPEKDICVEIKPTSMMNEIFEVKKKAAETIYNNFIVITEHHLSNEECLNEYFHLGS